MGARSYLFNIGAALKNARIVGRLEYYANYTKRNTNA